MRKPAHNKMVYFIAAVVGFLAFSVYLLVFHRTGTCMKIRNETFHRKVGTYF